ncbi:MAG: hypothetical protein HOO06_11710 [Bdellovibrionaceae bacterium]|nr:hypothetical protein [Pseudobdellovibrionaceae bacterium]
MKIIIRILFFKLILVLLSSNSYALKLGTPNTDVSRLLNKKMKIKVSISYIENGIRIPVVRLPFIITQELKPDIFLETDSQGLLLLNCTASTKPLIFRATMDNKLFRIFNLDRGEVDSFVFKASCGGDGFVTVPGESEEGGALWLWNLLGKVHSRMISIMGPQSWKKIPMRWSATRSIYNLSVGLDSHASTITLDSEIVKNRWNELIGHEIGHYVFMNSGINKKIGGRHSGTECVNEKLAFTEGMANFFSAWLFLDPKDQNAYFHNLIYLLNPKTELLIPFVNIPDTISYETELLEVCKGTANETRLGSFFWNLVVSGSKNKTSDEIFKDIWHALAGKYITNINEAIIELKKNGFDPDELDAIADRVFAL